MCGAQDFKGPSLGAKSRGTKAFQQGMARRLQETNVLVIWARGALGFLGWAPHSPCPAAESVVTALLSTHGLRCCHSSSSLLVHLSPCRISVCCQCWGPGPRAEPTQLRSSLPFRGWPLPCAGPSSAPLRMPPPPPQASPGGGQGTWLGLALDFRPLF